MGQLLEKEEQAEDRQPTLMPMGPGVRNRVADQGRMSGFMAELADFRQRLAHLEQEDPDQILLLLSACAGRLAEIRSDLWSMNGRVAGDMRVRQVEPLRKDLDFHFQVHSRRIALLEWELRMSGGQV